MEKKAIAYTVAEAKAFAQHHLVLSDMSMDIWPVGK